jgi:hypothetical protein
LKHFDALVEAFQLSGNLKDPHAAEDIKQFTAFFRPAGFEGDDKHQVNPLTHVAILSPLSGRWFDFFAGFSYGSGLSFFAYGEEAVMRVPEEFVSCFTPIKTEAALQRFLESETELLRKHEAAREIVRAREALLQMGIPISGESLANCAGEGGMREVSLFLAAGFSPDTRNKTGVPLLNIAARKGNWEVLRLLIQSDAQLNLQADDRGTSALIDSVMGKQYGLANDLIRAGADLNITSKHGQTALVVAVGAGDEKMVELLLKAGADPDIADSMGASARKYASLFHQSSVTTLFDAYAPKKAV